MPSATHVHGRRRGRRRAPTRAPAEPVTLLAHRPGGAPGRPRSASPVRRGPTEWNVLCTGYDAVPTAGYPTPATRTTASTSYWSQSTGHNCTNYVAYRLVTNGLPNKRAGHAVRQRLHWGSGVPDADQRRPRCRVGGLVGTVLLQHRAHRLCREGRLGRPDHRLRGQLGWRLPVALDHPLRRLLAGRLHPRSRTWGPTVAAPASYPTYRPVPPARIVDTRSGLGATGPLAAGSDDEHPRQRQGGPTQDRGGCRRRQRDGGPSPGGRLAADLPSGSSPAAASTLNFDGGDVVANQAVVGVGSDGRIRLKVSQTTDALVDIVGWYPAFGNLSTATPTRLLDTRYGLGAPTGRLAPGGRIDLAVTGTSVVPPSGVDSVLLNVTAARPSKDGNLAVWPAASAAPNSSSLNFSTGTSISGLVVAKVGSNGRVSIRASAATDVVADVVGWYPTAADYRGLTPARLLDTRNGTGVATSGADRCRRRRASQGHRAGRRAVHRRQGRSSSPSWSPGRRERLPHGLSIRHRSAYARRTSTTPLARPIANTACRHSEQRRLRGHLQSATTQVVADVQGYLQ